MNAPFQAFVVNQTADGFTMGIRQLEQYNLPPGEVLIQVLGIDMPSTSLEMRREPWDEMMRESDLSRPIHINLADFAWMRIQPEERLQERLTQHRGIAEQKAFQID